MGSDYLNCPMCGFGFSREDTLCGHGCPLGAMCRLVQCPSCKYEFPETTPAVTWVQRLLRKLPERAKLPDGVVTAADLKPGEEATLICLGDTTSKRHRTLTVFGLVPGARIRLIQRQPACVVKVGETELALDPEIARDVLVAREDLMPASDAATV